MWQMGCHNHKIGEPAFCPEENTPHTYCCMVVPQYEEMAIASVYLVDH